MRSVGGQIQRRNLRAQRKKKRALLKLRRKTIATVQCRACGGSLRKKFSVRRDGTFTLRRLEQRKCQRCGAVGSLFEVDADGPAKRAARAKRIAPRIAVALERQEQSPPERRSRWSEEYLDYIASPEWAALRRLVLARDQNRCLKCSANIAVRVLHVHHIHYRTLFFETGRELVTLCDPCHASEHRSGPLREREKLWRVEAVRGDAYAAPGTVLHHRQTRGGSPKPSGSTKPEAAGGTQRVWLRKSPAGAGAHVST